MNLVDFTYNLILISIAGLFIAFSPLLIITDMLIVLRSRRPLLHTGILLMSIALPLIVLGIAASFVIKPDTAIDLKAISVKLSVPPLFTLLLGCILGGMGYSRLGRLRHEKGIKHPPKKSMKPPPAKLLPLFTFGFMKSLLSVTNIFAILLVTKLIVTQNMNPLGALIILFWTIAIGLIPFFIVIYYHHNRRERLLNLQSRVEARLAVNLQLYIGIGLLAIGAALVIESILQFIW